MVPKRDKILGIRLTKGEFTRLKRLAQAAKLKVSDYVRRLLFS
jgi:hypothetical protein